MLRKLAIVLLTFTTLSSAGGKDFKTKHISCTIYGMLKDRIAEPDVYLALEEQLYLKRFNITYVSQNHRFKKDDLILTLEKEILNGFFPPCLVIIHIKKEGMEEAFFSAGTKRALPRRLNPKNFLCKLAVRDVLFQLPYCSKTSP